MGKYTYYIYDSYGNIASIVSPTNKITTYSYNKLGWLKSVTTPNGYRYRHFDSTNTAVTKTTYDHAGRQIKLDQADGIYTTNAYNANGTLADATDARGNTTYYQYDGLNRLIYTWSPVETNAYAFASTTYDKANRTIMTADAKNTVANGMLYSYDALGWVLTETDANDVVTSYTFNRK